MHASETPTGILRDQHQNILKIADILDRLLNAASDSTPIDYDAVGDCVKFIRLYADALHHGKEEDLLFPELLAHGMPKDGGPIAVMLHEHKLGRGFARTMAESLPEAKAGDAAAAKRLAGAGRSYIHLIRDHITLEETVVYHAGRQQQQQQGGPA